MVSIARECARSGKRVALIEQNDFASGTTSRSTRMIHGGLRYLERGEISLVRIVLDSSSDEHVGIGSDFHFAFAHP